MFHHSFYQPALVIHRSTLFGLWYIPDNITIIAKSQTISGQELLVTAQNYIKSNIPQAITDYTIENVNLPQDLLIREGTVTLKPVLPYGVRYNAPTNVFINVMVDDVLVKKVMYDSYITSHNNNVVISISNEDKQDETN